MQDEVTQAARDAAAQLMPVNTLAECEYVAAVKAGKHDRDYRVQAFHEFEQSIRHQAERETLARMEWKDIESPPKDGTKAVLFFPQDATDFDGVDYSLRLAIYRQNETFRHGTWCDQGTNHDSFEGPDMSGDDRASHYLALPPPPEAGQ